MNKKTQAWSLAIGLLLLALQAEAMPPRFTFTRIADDQGAPYLSLGFPAINNRGMVGFYASALSSDQSQGLYVQSGDTIYNVTPSWISSIYYAETNLTLADDGTIVFYGIRGDNFHPVIAKAYLPGGGGVNTSASPNPLAEVATNTDFNSVGIPKIDRYGGVFFNAYRRSSPHVTLEVLTGSASSIGGFDAADPQYESFNITPNGQVLLDIIDSNNQAGIRAERVTNLNRSYTYAAAVNDLKYISGYYANDTGRTLIKGLVGDDGNECLYANIGPYQGWKRIVDTRRYSAFSDIQDVSLNNSGLFVMTAWGAPNTPNNSAGVFIGGDYKNDRVLGPGDTLFGRQVREAWVGSQAINETGQIVMGVLMTTGESMIVRADPIVSGPADVTAKVTVSRGGYWYNRITNTYLQSVRVTNIGGSVLQGPLSLVLDDLNGADLKTISGHTSYVKPTLSPYVDINNGAPITLAPGQSFVLSLEFSGNVVSSAGYHVRVLAGAGNR